MDHPLLSLVVIAAITLLITALWAASFATAYWDLQKRSQAGERVRRLTWLVLVAGLPLIGWIAYWVARWWTHRGARRGETELLPVIRGETRLKSPQPAAEPGVSQETAAWQRVSETIAWRSPAAEAYRFTVVSGPDRGRQFTVERFPAQIGRSPDAAVRLSQDASVSRIHAEIIPSDGALRIRDLHSKHGTRVNGAQAADQALKPGDLVEVGATGLFIQKV